MSQLNYTVVRLDLATLRSGGAPIAECPVGAEYDTVTVIQLPGGALIDLGFGTNGEPSFIPLLAQGQAFIFRDDSDCPLFEKRGLFVRNPVGAGQVILLVGFSAGDA